MDCRRQVYMCSLFTATRVSQSVFTYLVSSFWLCFTALLSIYTRGSSNCLTEACMSYAWFYNIMLFVADRCQKVSDSQELALMSVGGSSSCCCLVRQTNTAPQKSRQQAVSRLEMRGCMEKSQVRQLAVNVGHHYLCVVAEGMGTEQQKAFCSLLQTIHSRQQTLVRVCVCARARARTRVCVCVCVCVCENVWCNVFVCQCVYTSTHLKYVFVCEICMCTYVCIYMGMCVHSCVYFNCLDFLQLKC